MNCHMCFCDRAIDQFIKYYNYHRYHEALDNLTPTDFYFGRSKVILDRRVFIIEQTFKVRRYQNLKTKNKIILDYEECIS